MRRVFADTYYWIALLNDRDQGHAAARAISQTLPQPGIVTTQEVLSEVLTYFSAHGRQVRQTVAAFIRQILTDPAITVHPQPSQSFLSGLALYGCRNPVSVHHSCPKRCEKMNRHRITPQHRGIRAKESVDAPEWEL